jgi:DNA-binding transcriptional ArsR family regulator
MLNEAPAAPAQPFPEPGSCDVPHEPTSAADAARDRRLPDGTAATLAETFKVLGDVTRIRLLDALATGELCVCDLAGVVGITESAVSHQLRLLRGLRLVRFRRSGRQVSYRLDDHHILGLLQQARRHVEELR